jgi:signal transduction histidine kinase
MGAEQRSIRNYIKTAFQIRGFYFQIAASGIILVALLMTYSITVLNKVSDALTASDSREAQQQLLMVAVMYGLSFVIYILCTLACMIVVGHRVGGATVAICNYIRALKRGDYNYGRTLRDGDELGQIMMELVDLSQQLKEREK